jgi:hypothetical protein
MNEKEIRAFVKGYVFDRPTLNITESEVYDEIKNILNELYEDDIDSYNQFYESSLLVKTNTLKDYLDNKYNYLDNINEVAGMIIGSAMFLPAVIAMIATYAGTPLTKFVYKTIESVGRTFEKVGKFFQNVGSKWQIKYNMINNTFKQCLEKARIDDLKKVGIPVYELLRKKPTKLFATVQQVKQAEILRECYTEAFIKTIILTSDMYFSCLKDAKRISEFKSSSSKDVIILLHSIPKMFRGSCNEIYQKLIEQLKQFDSYVEYVYPNENDRESVLEKLRRGISNQLKKY